MRTLFLVLASVLPLAAPWAAAADRPNILWLVSEDNDTFLGCYGDRLAHTPTLDKLAREGVLYERCFAWPVCAAVAVHADYRHVRGRPAARREHMRAQGKIPPWLKGFPACLREAGYYTSNNAKTDYNSPIKIREAWDACGKKAHWGNRPAGQPFFSVFNHEVTHESCLLPAKGAVAWISPRWTRPGCGFRPTSPTRRRCGRTGCATTTTCGCWTSQIAAKLKDLETDGLADDTIVFYYSDNGGVLPRSKRFLEESGTHVPLIIYFPPKWRHLAPAPPGSRIKEPVGFVDFAADGALAGGREDSRVHARPRLRRPGQGRGHRVRLHHPRPHGRTLRHDAFGHGQPLAVHPQLPARPALRPAAAATCSRPAATSRGPGWPRRASSRRQPRMFWGEKPTEELYDMLADPDSVQQPGRRPGARRDAGRGMRAALEKRVLANKDNGFMPEGSALEGYDGLARAGGLARSSGSSRLPLLASERDPANLPN